MGKTMAHVVSVFPDTMEMFCKVSDMKWLSFAVKALLFPRKLGYFFSAVKFLVPLECFCMARRIPQI